MSKVPRHLIIGTTALLLLSALAGCAKDLVTGKKAYNWFSIGEDIKLGDQVITEQLNELKRQGKKVDAEADPETYERVKKITARIGAVSHYPSFPMKPTWLMWTSSTLGALPAGR
jgi:hypothetical protein